MGGDAHTGLPGAWFIYANLRLDIILLYRKDLVKFLCDYKRKLTFVLTFKAIKATA
jgi:hypothetical protein